MTHSGGKAHEVGDREQRYEITFFNTETGSRQVYGWTDYLEIAYQLCSAIDKRPSWTDAEITDRCEIVEDKR